MGRNEEIRAVLEDLLKMEDVQACLLTGRQTGTITPGSGTKLKKLVLWKLIMDSSHKFFPVIEDFYVYGLKRLYFELGDYEVIMSFLDQFTALLVVIPSLVNRGLVEVEIENSKRAIKEIIGRQK
jgi:predicted regulator of Ras-like GTPase activity (Roadblock/LC7/MglB family)